MNLIWTKGNSLNSFLLEANVYTAGIPGKLSSFLILQLNQATDMMIWWFSVFVLYYVVHIAIYIMSHFANNHNRNILLVFIAEVYSCQYLLQSR